MWNIDEKIISDAILFFYKTIKFFAVLLHSPIFFGFEPKSILKVFVSTKGVDLPKN